MLQGRLGDSTNIDDSAMRLTDIVLRYEEQDLRKMLEAIAVEIGVRHIAYVSFPSDNSYNPSVLTAIATYPTGWQTDYILKGYEHSDPVIARGRDTLLPFEWETLVIDNPKVLAFFTDAAKHGLGRNGLSIPVRNRRGGRSLVSFTSNHSRVEWAKYMRTNMLVLQNLSSFIDVAADVHAKVPLPSVGLSRREKECLRWAATGKSAQEIAVLMDLGFALRKGELGHRAP